MLADITLHDGPSDPGKTSRNGNRRKEAEVLTAVVDPSTYHTYYKGLRGDPLDRGGLSVDGASLAMSVYFASAHDEISLRVCTDRALEEIDPLYHGSGLGLWLIYWIVERSNATVEFDENEPRESMVSVTFRRPST